MADAPSCFHRSRFKAENRRVSSFGPRGSGIDAEIRPALVPRLALVSQSPGFGNGRHVRNLHESAIVRQATRVTPASGDDELRTLRLVDFLDPAASVVHAAR